MPSELIARQREIGRIERDLQARDLPFSTDTAHRADKAGRPSGSGTEDRQSACPSSSREAHWWPRS